MANYRKALEPFAPSPRPWYRPNRTWLLAGFLLVFCVIYGFAFALTAPAVVTPFAIPIALVLMLVIWALPETGAPTSLMYSLFFLFFVGLVVWPNYISIALPGLPWLTVIRLTSLPLVLVFLISVSVSAELRRELGAVLSALPMLWKLLLTFVCIQLVSIAFSKNLSDSVDRFILAQIEWTAVFFISCIVFRNAKYATYWAACLWIMAVWVGAIAVWESRLGHVPWSGHIPSFLAIQDPNVSRILAGAARAGQYRAQSSFGTSLGLAEYIALSLPFIVHFAGNQFRWPARLAAVLSTPFLFYVVILSGSRLGVVGFVLTLLAFIFVWSVIGWINDRSNPLWATIVLAYPIIFSAAVAATFFIGRLHTLIWGSGAQQASSQARIEQFHLGIPKILSHPWGYGIGMGAETLGYMAPGTSILTIDSYYLMIALECGIIGFVVYYGMILFSIWYGLKYSFSIRPLNGESALLIPIAIALLNFFVIKSVFSQQDNHPIIFMIMGMLVALVWRIRNSAVGSS